jgi:hypothetical protein
MKLLSRVFITFLLLGFGSAFGQNTIKGKVVEYSHGINMSGVKVVLKGTTIKTYTNDNGEFELEANSESSTLVFSAKKMFTEEVDFEGLENLYLVMYSKKGAIEKTKNLSEAKRIINSAPKLKKVDILKKWSETPQSGIEGFYRLKTEYRDYVIAIVKSNMYYLINYIGGELDEWKEGNVKGVIFPLYSRYRVFWNSGKPESNQLSHFFTTFKGESFILHSDKFPVVFNKLNPSEMSNAQESMMDYGTSLMKATISDENYDEVVRLVKEGADILEEDEFGNNAIDWANYFGSYEVSNYLNSYSMLSMFVLEISMAEFGELDNGPQRKNLKCGSGNYKLFKGRLNNGVLAGIFIVAISDGLFRPVFKEERHLSHEIITKCYDIEWENDITDAFEEYITITWSGCANELTYNFVWSIPNDEWNKYRSDEKYNFKCNLVLIIYENDLYDQWESEGHNWING